MLATSTQTDLFEGLVAALVELGLQPNVAEPSRETTDLVFVEEVSGTAVMVQCKSYVTPQVVRELEAQDFDGYKMLAANTISKELRADLIKKAIGFYDGRGHLRLVHPPLIIDTAVSGVSPAIERRRRLRIDGGALLDVSLAALVGLTAKGVRSTAAEVDRAPGTVSKNLALLREAFLVDEANRAVVPDLFETVVSDWLPYRVHLAAMPERVDGGLSERLQLGVDDGDLGWVLADVHAAAAWGAPVVLDATSPPDFYVPSERAASNAEALLGSSTYANRACTISVAPSLFVCRHRFDRGSVWPAPSPVIAALDLASDPGRGREILDGWSEQLSDEVERVW